MAPWAPCCRPTIPPLADFGGAGLENCNENLCRTRPEWVRNVHRSYLAAGSDIIETNSFQGSPIVLAEFNLEDQTHELNVLAAEIGAAGGGRIFNRREAALCRRIFGTHHQIDHLARRRYVRPNARQLLRAGPRTGGRRRRYSAVETAFDTRNIKAGMFAIAKLERDLGVRIPLMISGTIERWGAMLAGQPVDAFYASVSHADLLSVGLNCATGPGSDDRSYPHAF